MKNINLFHPKFRNEEIFNHISECLDKGWTGLGFKTLQIEEEWKKYTKLPNAHFLNSNTSGLHLAVKILKDTNHWKEGDEIITTPLTFVSTNHAILYENLHPVFADVDEYLCLNPDSVKERITNRTRAILFVGVGGNTGQLNKIIEICKEKGLKLILDAAHMSGTIMRRGIEGGYGYYDEHACRDADVSIFSFQAVKNLPTADSGMICFKDADLDSLARKLSWLGIDKDTYQRTNQQGSYKWEYEVIDAGFKYHGNSIMASMALVGLKYLEEDNKRRREICSMYDKGFENTTIKIIKQHSDCIVPSRHLYQIAVKNRNTIMEYLNSEGIYPGVHYRDNTLYEIYNYANGTCPYAKQMSDELISLPLHLFLTDEDVNFVIEKINWINNSLNKE